MAADSGMDTCPSPEIADSRKRPLDGDTENGDIKRSHFSSGEGGCHTPSNCMGDFALADKSGGDVTYHFKTLVPSVAAGAIIGKGGDSIAQLQRETGARIKMSKSHDYYPGTTERVCLISGTVEAILAVMDFLTEKIREKPDLTKSFTESDPKIAQERDKQIKILVPNSTAGMIIGKAGNYIKQIKENSGSYVQISQKAKDISLQERCITVIGDKESNKKACMMILSKVVDDAQSGVCLNVSYADVVGLVANSNPSGSPYAHSQQGHAFSSSTASLNSSGLSAVGGPAGVLVNGSALGSLNLTLNLGSPQAGPSPISPQMLEHIKANLRITGYSERGVAEISAALNLLAEHGILALGLSPPQPQAPLSYLPVDAAAATAAASLYGAIGQATLGENNNNVYNKLCHFYQQQAQPGTNTQICSTSPTLGPLERFTAEVGFDAFRPSAVAPISLNNNSFGLATGGAQGQALMPISKSPTPGDLGGAKDTEKVEVGEVIVGAILGPGGRNLNQIIQLSGANIQISKKGDFAPGTRNRIVTISGTPTAIRNAHLYIQQRITEEERKRARHGTLSGIM